MRLLASLALVAAFAAACGSADAAAPPSIPADAVVIVADGMRFETASVQAPAGRPLVLAFENRDGPPHNVHLRDAAGATVVQTEIFTGPGTRVADVPALAPGNYSFICDVHPDMTGHLMAMEEGS